MSVSPVEKKKRPWWQWAIVGTVGFLALCCVGSLIISALNPQAPATAALTATSAPAVALAATDAPQATTAPTEAPAATEAPAPTEAPATPTEPPVAPTAAPAVGTRIEAGDHAMTVMAVSRAPQLGDFFKPKDGNEFVVVDVLIEATADKVPYNLFYFSVKDADSREYTVAIGADQALQSGELPAGEKVRGNVAFEVPAGATRLVLTYKPLQLFGGADAIRVPLPDA